MSLEYIAIAHIDELIYQMEHLTHDLSKAVEDGINETCGKMVTRMELELANVGLSDSRLAQTIEIVPEPDGVRITVGADYAMFVEYGTGIVGMGSPHPHPEMDGWEYDSNFHGNDGWWYPTDESDPNPYKRRSKLTGELYAWTKGQVAHPFVYNTWVYGKRILAKIVNKHINRLLAKNGLLKK